jgi:hypothetical protein
LRVRERVRERWRVLPCFFFLFSFRSRLGSRSTLALARRRP